jgi:hypothetical protein
MKCRAGNDLPAPNRPDGVSREASAALDLIECHGELAAPAADQEPEPPSAGPLRMVSLSLALRACW